MARLKYSSKLLASFGVTALCAALLGPPVTSAREGKQQTNATGAAIKGFLDRVNAYAALQKKAEDGLPGVSDEESPSKIEAHQAAVAGRMKLAREHARPGDIFGDAAPLFKAAIAKDAALRPKKEEKAAMEEVPKFDPSKVNVPYPEKLARATVPPLLLDTLPRLPEGLEYRFMGNDLILRDTKANLIADFIRDAIKPLADGK